MYHSNNKTIKRVLLNITKLNITNKLSLRTLLKGVSGSTIMMPAILLTLSSTASSANFLKDPGFEIGYAEAGENWTDTWLTPISDGSAWTRSVGSCDAWAGGPRNRVGKGGWGGLANGVPAVPNEGGNFVACGGWYPPGERISQLVTGVTPGTSYTLSFWYTHAGVEDLTPDAFMASAGLWVDGKFIGATKKDKYLGAGNQKWRKASFTYKPKSSSFQFTIGYHGKANKSDYGYIAFDGATVETTVPAVNTSLTIITQITNDDGGGLAVSDFNINTDAGTIAFGAAVPSNGGNTQTFTSSAMVVSGQSYLLQADDLFNYTATDWSCTGDLNPSVLLGFQEGLIKADVTLSASDKVTCMISYNDKPTDHGDAPQSYGDATHGVTPDLFIGSVMPDGESTALNSVNGDTDGLGDNDTNSNDESTLLSFPELTTKSTTYSLVDIPVKNTMTTPATLTGWLDFNSNGLFEAEESTGLNIPASSGTTLVTLDWSNLPQSLTEGVTYLRLRLTETSVSQTPSGAGLLGEVEDYAVPITKAASCSALTGIVNAGITPIAKLRTGKNVFLATNDLSANTGTLKAYSIQADGTLSSSAAWTTDASVNKTQRDAGLYSASTVTGNHTLTLLKTLKPQNTLANADIGSISPNSNLLVLDGKVNIPLYLSDADYRSFKTSTLAQRSGTNNATTPKLVIASSDDGFVYGVKQGGGALHWGWMPASLIQFMGDTGFSDQHYMQGEMDLKDLKSGSTYASYLIGSYRNGLGQYVLKLSSDSGLESVVWDTDHQDIDPINTQAPNSGKRAYFKDVNHVPYLVYITTTNQNLSTLHIRSILDTTVHHSISLGFTATSSPFVMPSFKGPHVPANNTLYLGDNSGNIYSVPLLTTGLNGGILKSASTLNSELQTTAITKMGTAATSAVRYLGANVSRSGQTAYLYAQSDDRVTTYVYDPTDSFWKKNWTTSTSEAGKWVAGNNGLVADKGITQLPNGSTITDEISIIANSIVVPITGSPSVSNCYGTASYYLYTLNNGHTPSKTFYDMSDDSAIIGNVTLGTGKAKTLEVGLHPATHRLIGYGLAAQDVNGNTGISKSIYIEDPIATGIRSWRLIK